MKIQYASDLHLEFRENKRFLEEHPLAIAGEVLILAGDILPFLLHEEQASFIDYLAHSYEMVYWIPGNHEYYQYDIASVADPLVQQLRSNVWLINNQVVTYKNINFICSTLWSNISPVNALEIQRYVSDFFAIHVNGKRFTTRQFNELHHSCFSFLQTAFNTYRDQQNIVITHHVPTFQNYPPKYRHSALNDAFAVELHDFIHDCGASHWIYGHHHYNAGDFMIGNTQLLTNQLGYVSHHEQAGFRTDAFFEV